MSSSPTDPESGETAADRIHSQEILDLANRDLAQYRGRRLGDMAVERSWITREQLAQCLEEQSSLRQTPGGSGRLGSILVARGLLTEEQVGRLLRDQQGRDFARFERVDTPSVPREVLDAQSQPGRSVGKYVLVEEIGRGGMGKIWKAWDPDLHRWVAIKLLHENVSSPALRTRFQREARVAAGIRHPNLVTVHDFGESDGRPWFVMELIDGRPLNVHGAKEESLHILRKVAEALEEAHRNGIVHRDLKPGNILIDRKGEPHVVDFGLAHLLDAEGRLTQSGSVLGTPMYMAPEQVRGRAEEIGVRTDVYALGAMLYEVLEGHVPHEGATPAEIHDRILREDPPPPRGTRDLVTICMKAISKEPSRRYDSAGMFAEDLKRYINGDPIIARPASWIYRVRKRIAKRKTLVGTIAGASVVACALLLAVHLVRESRFGEAKDRGMEAYAAGDWANALSSFEMALALKKDPELSRLAVECRAKIGDAEAYAELRRSLDPFEQKIRVLNERFRIGNVDIRAELDRVEKILPALEETAREPRFEKFPDAWSLLGEARYHLCDEKGAVEALTEATDRDPGHGRSGLYLVRIYLERAFAAHVRYSTETEEARRARRDVWREEARKVLARFSGGAESDPARKKLILAYSAFLEGDYASLQRICEEGIERFGKDIGVEEFWNLLGVMTDGEERVRVYTGAIEARPHYPWGYYCRGTAQFGLGRIREAAEDFGRVLEIHPGLRGAIVGRAICDGMMGRPEDSIRGFTRAIELEPGDAMAWFNRGLAYRNTGDLDRAIRDYSEAIQLRPDYAQAHMNRGAVYARQGRHEEAIADYSEAIRIDAGFLDAYLNRGNAYARLNRNEEAVRDYTAVLDRAPDHPRARFLRGMVRMNAKDPRGAVGDFERALKSAPPGWPLREEAERLLEEARARAGGDE